MIRILIDGPWNYYLFRNSRAGDREDICFDTALIEKTGDRRKSPANDSRHLQTRSVDITPNSIISSCVNMECTRCFEAWTSLQFS